MSNISMKVEKYRAFFSRRGILYRPKIHIRKLFCFCLMFWLGCKKGSVGKLVDCHKGKLTLTDSCAALLNWGCKESRSSEHNCCLRLFVFVAHFCHDRRENSEQLSVGGQCGLASASCWSQMHSLTQCKNISYSLLYQ